jgi:hypothetical protein
VQQPDGPAGTAPAPEPTHRRSGTKQEAVNLHSKLTQRDHLKMTHLRGSKAHRRAAPM